MSSDRNGTHTLTSWLIRHSEASDCRQPGTITRAWVPREALYFACHTARRMAPGPSSADSAMTTRGR